MPCFTADKASIEALQALLEKAPETVIDARVDTGVITAGDADDPGDTCRPACATRS